MSDLKTVCEQILRVSDSSGRTSYRSESTELSYEVLAANNAHRLAKACLILQEALEFYTEKSVFEQGHGLGFHEDAAEALANVEELFK